VEERGTRDGRTGNHTITEDKKQMPIRMNITPKDVKAQKIVRPGWYASEIKEVSQGISADKESTNTRVDIEGLDGDAAGVPVPTWFSEKFPQGAIAFVKATGGRVTEEEGIDPEYDFEAQVGKKVMAHIVTSRGKSGNDKPRNQVDDWAPMAGTGASKQVETVSFENV
jgi:hypothetical protein